MPRPLLLVALLLWAATLLAAASPAQAGRYDVSLCSSAPMPADSAYQIEIDSSQRAYRGVLVDACGKSGSVDGLAYLISPQNAQRYDTTNGLGVRIPDELPNLRIRVLRVRIVFRFGPDDSSTFFPRVTVPGRTLYENSSRGDIDVEDSVNADVDTRSFEYLTYCSADRGAVDCKRHSSNIFSLSDANLTLEDPVAPDAARIGGDLASGGPKRGTVKVVAGGGDVDSGVRAVVVKLGETTVAAQTRTPVKGQWRPYPRTVDDGFEVDTTKLADATYPLTATIADAGGATRVASGGDVVVDNLPPVPTGRPVISGVADAGQTLTASAGTWKDLNGSNFAFRWLRCNARGDLCQAIPGAGSSRYVATATDVGSSLRLEVVATDASGSATQTSDPSPPVTGTPSADAPNPPFLLGVRGLTNPLAGRGAAPNGANASESARLVAALRAGKRGRRRTVVRRFGHRPVVVGSLRVGRTPVSGALVTIAERRLGGEWRALTTVTTSARGSISATLPAGPTRSLQLFYFPRGDSTTAVTSRRLTAGTKARVTFKATPSNLRNKESIRLIGRVSGNTSPRGVLVSIQVRRPERRWQTFRVARTDATGAYRTRYRFLRSRRGDRYRFRAVATAQAGLPYNTGASRTLVVRIR